MSSKPKYAIFVSWDIAHGAYENMFFVLNYVFYYGNYNQGGGCVSS